MARSSSSSNLLVAVILIFTFPIWVSLIAVFFGLVAGLFGAVIGIIGGIFGLTMGIIALPFKLLFGWGDWGCNVHWSPVMWVALLIVAALIVRGKNK